MLTTIAYGKLNSVTRCRFSIELGPANRWQMKTSRWAGRSSERSSCRLDYR